MKTQLRHRRSLPFPGESTACLYVPVMVLDGREVELLGYLGRRHGALQVLLVGEEEYGRMLQVLDTWREGGANET